MGVSQGAVYAPSEGDTEVVTSAPAVLTGVIVAETTGTGPAVVALREAAGPRTYAMFSAPAHGTVTFANRVAAPYGLAVAAVAGEATVSVFWE